MEIGNTATVKCDSTVVTILEFLIAWFYQLKIWAQLVGVDRFKLFRRWKWREVRSSIWWLFLSKCGPFQVYGTLDGTDDPSCKYMNPALWWVVSTSLVYLGRPHCFKDPNHWSDGLHEINEIVNSTQLGWLNNTDLQWLGPNSDNLDGITIHSRIWWGQQADCDINLKWYFLKTLEYF